MTELTSKKLSFTKTNQQIKVKHFALY